MTMSEPNGCREDFCCPSCGTSQQRSDLCVNCGLVFEKYFRREQQRAAGIELLQSSPAGPSSAPRALRIAVLAILLAALGAILYHRLSDDSAVTGATVSGAPIPEHDDPNLARSYEPYPGTVIIRHDLSFMDWPHFAGATRLDAMGLDQIAAYRKAQIKRYAQLGLFRQGYDPLVPPHNQIYGQITPGTPWITTVPYYIANPYILLSLTHDNQVAPFTVFLDNVELVYAAGKISEVHTGRNGTIWKEFLASDQQKPNVVQIIMVNAWDAGFYHVHLVENQSENVVPATSPDNIGKALYSQSSFYHVGQHGKNNISPYDGRGCITLRDIAAPTKLVFHLWRKKPSSAAVKPDLVYEMRFVPE